MKQLFIVLSLLAVATKGYGQQTIQIEAFDKISISSTANIKLVPSSSHNIRAVAEDITSIFSVRNGTLTVSSPAESIVEVGVTDLKEIRVSGNGTISSDSAVPTTNLGIYVSGKLVMHLKLATQNLLINTSGVSKGDISGSATAVEFNTSGITKIDAQAFKTKKFTASISGSCKTTIDVTDELNTNVSGSATIYYVTRPTLINANNSGIAKVEDVANRNNGDTTRVSVGNININIAGDTEEESNNRNLNVLKKSGKSASSEPHWGGLEIGINGYAPGIDGLEQANDGPTGYKYLQLKPAKSIVVNLNLYELKAKLIKRYLWFNSGIGVTWNNYRFDNGNYVLRANTDSVSAVEVGRELIKNKLTVSYITIPAMIELNTSQYMRKSFHLGVGVVGAYRMGSHTKYKSTEGTNKTRDDFNLNPVRLDARVCLGYRNWNIFAQYGLTTLFREERLPKLYPFSLGLSLLSF